MLVRIIVNKIKNASVIAVLFFPGTPALMEALPYSFSPVTVVVVTIASLGTNQNETYSCISCTLLGTRFTGHSPVKYARCNVFE